MTSSVPGDTTMLSFVSDYPTPTPPQHWTTIATAQNQVQMPYQFNLFYWYTYIV